MSVEGLDEHVVCATLEQALEVAGLLSQQHQRRVIVQEQGATYHAAIVGPGSDQA